MVTLLSRGAMVLLVFAWRFGPPLHDIETAAENTGLAHVFPNKGALAKIPMKPMEDEGFSIEMSGTWKNGDLISQNV